MDENLSRGYIQLGKKRAVNDLRFSNGFSHLSPPVDKYNGIYLALVLAGVGFLLPYNSFTIAVDYFQARYPNTTIVFDMSLVYIVMAFFAVMVNNILVETLSLNTRITFGYIISFVTLLFVAFAEVWWEMFPPNASYTINLFAVAIVALGCTVQQSSFYGYTSMLPSRYTQAVMAGESTAGFIVSVNRIITKSLLNDQRVNTMIFFALSIIIIGLCFALHRRVNKTEFVQFYINLCNESKKITLEPQEDIGLMDPTDQPEQSSRNQYGVLKLETSPPEFSNGHQYSTISFANPAYEPQSNGPTYKVEDVVIGLETSTTRRPGRWRGFKRGIVARVEVAKVIWPYMLTICLAYFVTLCLYPGIESEITSCRLGSWMPVIIMAVFNASDLFGKMVASISYDWSRTTMLIFASCRILLVPMLLLCAMPRGRPFIPGEWYPMVFSVLLGLTNGMIGSMPMILAPSKVSEEHRELTGNIMTLSYNLGLTGGSLVAYLLDDLLGPPIKNPCMFMWGPTPIFKSRTPKTSTPLTTISLLVTTTVTTLLTTNVTKEIIVTTLQEVNNTMVTLMDNTTLPHSL